MLRFGGDLMRIYTRLGDLGTTGTQAHGRQSKASLQVEVTGSLDQCLAALGFALCACPSGFDSKSGQNFTTLHESLIWAQHRLFTCAVCIFDSTATDNPLAETDSEGLEFLIDSYAGALPHFKAFVLPGSSELSARLHLARTAVREAERTIVRVSDAGLKPNPLALTFLNRLSDFLFTCARYGNHQLGIDDTLWQTHPRFPHQEQ